MTKLSGILLGLMLVLFVQNISFAQTKKKDDNFPTYDQIRGNKAETVDYVSPAGGEWLRIKRDVVVSPYFNAFSFPDDSVTYYLNGKKVKSKKKAEKELEEKSMNVEKVSVGPIEDNGKRIVRIDYEPRKD
ncbi:hypothetical protein [Dyadobacter pollutisoli]|jgi:hypothetical protein|uniref:Uncharacterized protein n=1 Tax=Dyadobacter pollutisoli TaxID=2910158 RepID=A0A9E8NAV9_9BACT|nr:hypothetical protein [Dyadobacter pollutisoli]WAC11953.1 hypothetical protein ON006_30020 [Dyadobacter pollutisoli]